MSLQLLLPWGSLPAAALPRTWSEALADRAGDWAAMLGPAARRSVARNLHLVTGREPSSASVRGAFRTYARYYLAMMRAAHLDVPGAVGAVQWQGDGALADSLQRGSGALILSAHLGNWDVVGFGLAQRYGSLCAFVEVLRPRPVFEFYSKVRRRHGVQVSAVGSPGRLPVEVLQRGGILALVADRPFGLRRAATACGAATLSVPAGGIRLALRSGAAVHAVFAVRVPGGFELRCGPDWAAAAGSLAGEEARVQHVADLYAAALRDVVSAHAEQWCLMQALPAAGGSPATARLTPSRATGRLQEGTA